MKPELYRYSFDTKLAFQDIEQSLLLAVLAAESLHGRERVRLDASFRLDPKRHSCEVEATSEVGHSIARIFAGFISREFGEDAFQVDRVGGADTGGSGQDPNAS